MTCRAPGVGILLDRHENSINECRGLRSWCLTPIDISYQPQINSRPLQEERTGSVSRRARVVECNKTANEGESQGGGSGFIIGRVLEETRFGAGQVMTPEETKVDVGSHSF